MNKLPSSASYQRKHSTQGTQNIFLDHKLFLKKILDDLDPLCGIYLYMCVFVSEKVNVSAWWH